MLLVDILALIDVMDVDEVRELYQRHQRYEDAVTQLEDLIEDDGGSYSPMLVNRMMVVQRTRAFYLIFLEAMQIKYRN